MAKPFSELSYRGQVQRLTVLARNALERYPVRVKSLKFINHGENTTYKVTARDGRKFMLRIHRDGYHTRPAILEELRWLDRLGEVRGLRVPKPVRSKGGELIEAVEAPGVPRLRHCALFEWVDGRFLGKSLRPAHLFEVGRLAGRLQNSAKRIPARHRRYWSAEGLLGEKPMFTCIDGLPGVPAKDQRLLTAARKRILKQLKAFERRHPERLGLIHADMHFGNMLLSPEGLGAIDFDDCGVGFHAYDLAIPLISVERFLKGRRGAVRYEEFKAALLRGYATERSWTREDDRILPELVTARKLMMLGWIASRSENPRLKKFLKKAVREAVKHLKSVKGSRP